MPGQSYVIEPTDEGDQLVLVDSFDHAAATLLRSGRVNGVTLNYARGFRERDLDFIEPWPIRRLDLLARTIEDLRPVNRLANSLVDLRVTSAPQADLDLSALPGLTSLIASDWAQVRETIRSAPSLDHLGLGGYSEMDLQPLAHVSGLRSLRIKQTTLRSLEGIQELKRLESFELFAAKRLADLDALAHAPTTMYRLWFITCGGITRLDSLSRLQGLTQLSVANCGPVESLAPLGGLGKLTRLNLSESTRVGDGDLSPLLRLKQLSDLRIMSRRHYRPSVAAVKAALGLD